MTELQNTQSKNRTAKRNKSTSIIQYFDLRNRIFPAVAVKKEVRVISDFSPPGHCGRGRIPVIQQPSGYSHSMPGAQGSVRACVFSHSVSVMSDCNPMDCSSPGSSVHGISQGRILEWVAIPLSRGSSQPRDRTCISSLQDWEADSLPLSHQGSPKWPPIILLMAD